MPIVLYELVGLADRRFGGKSGQRLTLFVQNWVNAVLHTGLIRLILLNTHNQLQPEDRAFFRASREKRFGALLESVQAGGNIRWRLSERPFSR